MKPKNFAWIAAACGVMLFATQAIAHPGHEHDHDDHDHHHHHAEHEHDHDASAHQQNEEHVAMAPTVAVPFFLGADGDRTSGQDALKFKVMWTGDALPEEAKAVLVNAHGGFAVDRREGKGEVYFALPGAGILQISADLGSAKVLTTPEEMKGTNLHNTGIWYNRRGDAYLVFPANDMGAVFTTTLDGGLVNKLDPPADFDFDDATVNKYFKEGGKFVPTDVEYLNGLYYIATGYSALDYVLTAQVRAWRDFNVEWNDLVFGGKGDAPGQFGTGHGITVTPDEKRIVVADRPNAQLERFTRYGHYRDTVTVPAGSLPCDVDYIDNYTVVGCLEGPDKSKGAPIYILENDQVVSTVMPKEELGLENFTHIHNAVMTKKEGLYYLIAQAWNPGGFAVLQQVK